MVRAASLVWKRAEDQVPVSAAVMANEMVSRSRNSPMAMTSGSSRRAARSAAAKDPVCLCTWRWLTTQVFERCTNSMGSSTQMMWSGRSSVDEIDERGQSR